jgi:hypothetical protein
MFNPMMLGNQEPLPPKRKAEKEMVNKLKYFIVGCVALRAAPYIMPAIVNALSDYIKLPVEAPATYEEF